MNNTELNKALRILDEAVDRLLWIEGTMETIQGYIPIKLSKEREELKGVADMIAGMRT